MNTDEVTYSVFCTTYTGMYAIGVFKNGVYMYGLGEFSNKSMAHKYMDALTETVSIMKKESCLVKIAEQMDKEQPKRPVRKLVT